jgi:hypothetical protein
MARYEFTPEAATAAADPEAGDLLDLFGRALDVIARIVGLILLGIGFWLALAVIAEGWDLYRRPEGGRIEQIARAINRGSNIDEVLTPPPPAPRPAASAEATRNTTDPVAAQLEPALEAPPPPEQPRAPPLRLSYFGAWFVALALLAILGQLAMLAIRTGGGLVTRDRRPMRG